MAAGFPHFSTGLMRSCGRETFIALRDLFLVTGRFAEARDQLIAFAACLRHDRIPNVRDGCLHPHSNARDATSWFLQTLQDYALMSDEGGNVFKLQIRRLFPSDDQDEHTRVFANSARPIVSMVDIVQEILTRHANGIHFREWNTGEKLDSVMCSEGFILGGNETNSGTWMDKMGISGTAHNRGIAATPRDRAVVELIGLLKSALRWLAAAHEEGAYSHSEVEVDCRLLTWAHWLNLI
jgi:glycogen debranching enzyme